MSEVATSDLTARARGVELSKLEKTAIRALSRVPGVQFNESSTRVALAVRGSAWTIAAYGATQLLRLATTLVLARHLLGPSAFGLVALVNVFLTGLDMLSDLGIGMDVVQHKRGDDPDFINTAFVIQAGRGLILWVIATALAYPFAVFYHQPEIIPLAIAGAFSVAVRGVASSSVWLMTRHVQLGKLALLSMVGEAAGFVVSLTWAFISPSAWALVVGRVAAAVAFTVGSHVVADQRVSTKWDRSAARDILVFGTGILLSSVTYFLGGEAERLLVGKFITLAELGCFSLALTIASAPLQAIRIVSGQVVYPLIAQSIRTDQATATRHFKSARLLFLFLSIVIGAGFIVLGNKLVALLLPPKYAPAGWMLQWLGFRAAHNVFALPTSNLILAAGDSKNGAIANTARLILMVGVWIAFEKYGLYQAIAVLAFSTIIAYLVFLPAVARHLRSVLRLELLAFALFMFCMGVAAMLPWIR